MAGQGPFLPQVAIAGAPAAFPGAPAAVATPAAVTPQDVVAAADYMNAVKQLKSVWQTLAEFYRSILSSYVVFMHFADCCNLCLQRQQQQAKLLLQRTKKLMSRATTRKP